MNATFVGMNKALIPAYLLTFVNVLGFSILMPVLPFIVEAYEAPKWVYGLLLTLYSAFQFVGAPYLGNLSDELGRKPVLVISQAGTLLSWVVFLLALYLPNTGFLGFALPLWIIAFSRILDGITGGNISVTNAYVADVTTKEEKSYIFGYLGGIVGIGLIIGPGIGGFTSSSSFGYPATLVTAMVISIVALITIFLWLKESLPPEKRAKKTHHSVFESFFLLRQIRQTEPKPVVKLLFLLKLLFSAMSACYMGTIVLFIIDIFDFNEKEIGLFMLAVGIFLAFNQAVAVKFFIKRLGVYKTLVLGLGLSALGMYAITITEVLWAYLAFYYILNLGFSMCFPTFTALFSLHADPKKQGQIMGISEGINSFAMTVFPVLAAYLYSRFGHSFYWIVGLLPFTGFLIVLTKKKEFSAE